MNYPNPCDKCGGCDNRHGCAKWQKRFRVIWKQFNGYPKRRAREKMKIQKFRYEHPDIIRHWINKNPCEGCKREKCCDVPCERYLGWYDARMAVVRHKLGADHDMSSAKGR